MLEDNYRRVIATLPFEVKIQDFDECSLSVSISDGRRRCVWYCYNDSGFDALIKWLRFELKIISYNVD